MQKIGYVAKFFLIVVLLGLTSCLTFNSQVNKKSSQSEKEVSLVWFAASPLKDTDIVSNADAKLFIEDIYQTIDEKIFDPAFKKQEREQNFNELIAEVDKKQNWSRSQLTKRINNQLKKLSMSHLKILDPIEGEKLFRLFEEEPSSDLKSDPAVSAEMKDEIGILRVKSFIIPQITKAAVDLAKAQLSQAKVILIDLRGNGGGSVSSISYVIEDIIGADKIIDTDRSRRGLTMEEPYIFRGYFEDSINFGGEAEIKLSQEKGYIQWRTRSHAKKDSRPYYILVDDRCGSACDAFAATIQDYQAATILGVRTMGMLFGGEAFKLKWHGYALIVPVTQVISPKGRIIEGVGVQPDIEIPECKNGGEQCLEKAIELVIDNRYSFFP
jgi:C-terminal processing protease CtpA/Prc